jgi:hypothetical protein
MNPVPVIEDPDNSGMRDVMRDVIAADVVGQKVVGLTVAGDTVEVHLENSHVLRFNLAEGGDFLVLIPLEEAVN